MNCGATHSAGGLARVDLGDLQRSIGRCHARAQQRTPGRRRNPAEKASPAVYHQAAPPRSPLPLEPSGAGSCFNATSRLVRDLGLWAGLSQSARVARLANFLLGESYLSNCRACLGTPGCACRLRLRTAALCGATDGQTWRLAQVPPRTYRKSRPLISTFPSSVNCRRRIFRSTMPSKRVLRSSGILRCGLSGRLPGSARAVVPASVLTAGECWLGRPLLGVLGLVELGIDCLRRAATPRALRSSNARISSGCAQSHRWFSVGD
jgi:hypothetical protein